MRALQEPAPADVIDWDMGLLDELPDPDLFLCVCIPPGTLDVLNKKYLLFLPDLSLLFGFAIRSHLVLISYFMFTICDSIFKREHFPAPRPARIQSRFLILLATCPDSHFLFNNFLFKVFGVYD